MIDPALIGNQHFKPLCNLALIFFESLIQDESLRILRLQRHLN